MQQAGFGGDVGEAVAVVVKEQVLAQQVMKTVVAIVVIGRQMPVARRLSQAGFEVTSVKVPSRCCDRGG